MFTFISSCFCAHKVQTKLGSTKYIAQNSTGYLEHEGAAMLNPSA